MQVREIYEMAVEAEPPYSLTDVDCKLMCIRYARLETKVCVPKVRLTRALQAQCKHMLLASAFFLAADIGCSARLIKP